MGDITKIHGDAVPIVDVITGGSPCQDLSCAGKRAGLAGERSGLFMEQIRIIKEMRDESRKRLHDAGADYDRTAIKPRYMVWENVPGAFSSNKGEDFRCVLEETAKVADKDAVIPGPPKGKWTPAGCIMGDGWSIAWRVHDAQFWGVPQRRKRIALVADFGGETAPEILFERKGLSGDIAESAEKGQTVAGDVGAGIEKTGGAIAFEPGAMSRVGGHIYGDDKSGTIRANAGDNQQAVAFTTEITPKVDESETAFSLRSRDYKDPQSVCYGISSYDSNGMKSDNPHAGIYEADTSRTLDLNGGNPGCNQGGMMVVQGFDGYNQQSTGDVAMPLRNKAADSDHIPVVYIEGNGSRPSHMGNGYVEFDTMYTLNSTEHHAVAVESHAQDARYNVGDINQPLSANMEHDSANGGLVMVVENHPADSRVKISGDGVVQTLSGRMGTGGGNVPMVMEKKTYSIEEKMGNTYIHEEQGNTLGARDYKQPQAVVTYQNTTGTLFPGAHAGGYNGQDAYNDMLVVNSAAVDCRNCTENPDTNGTLQAKENGGQSLNYQNTVRCGAIVRRLTPLECERLQGFPDNWTNIGDWVDSKGKTHKGESDSPRYKALGNSIALPFWEWMAKRMVKYLEEESTMASLFSGIGGFELVFSRAGCKPVWNSEIESFPEAVTRIHFGDDEGGIKGDYEQYL